VAIDSHTVLSISPELVHRIGEKLDFYSMASFAITSKHFHTIMSSLPVFKAVSKFVHDDKRLCAAGKPNFTNVLKFVDPMVLQTSKNHACEVCGKKVILDPKLFTGATSLVHFNFIVMNKLKPVCWGCEQKALKAQKDSDILKANGLIMEIGNMIKDVNSPDRTTYKIALWCTTTFASVIENNTGLIQMVNSVSCELAQVSSWEYSQVYCRDYSYPRLWKLIRGPLITGDW